MHSLGCRSIAQSSGDLLVCEEAVQQCLEMGIGEAGDVGIQLCPQFIHILGCLGEEVSEFELALRSAPDAIYFELKSSVKSADERANLYYIALLEQGRVLSDIVPHASFHLAGSVGQRQLDIGGPARSCADLFLSGNEIRSYRLLFVSSKVRYVDIFHLAFERVSPTAARTPVL